MSRQSSPTPSETEAREEALRSRERRDVLEIFDDRAMGYEDDDPVFPDDFHGFDGDSSPRRGRRYRDRSPSRSKSRDRFLSPSPSVELPASALDVVSRQRSHRLRKWMVEGLAKDTSKSLRIF